jgi:AcrR family transcriptional regulator
MATETERPLRRDAERNRQRILQAAGEVFAERGLDVSMDDIARHAGVGVGTVYRRFPSKELLIEALFEDRIGQVVSIAQESLEVDDPWDGLVDFLVRVTEVSSLDRGLKQLLLSSTHGQDRVAYGRDCIVPLVDALVTRAQEAGQLRDDIAHTDFALLQMGLGAVAEYAAEVNPDVWRRCLVLLLDGMRAQPGAATPMPVPPLALEQVECAMREWRPQR